MIIKPCAMQSYYSYKGLFHWLHFQAMASNLFVRPALMLALFTLAGRFAAGQEAAQRIMLGMAVNAGAWFLVGSITQTYFNDRDASDQPCFRS